MFIFPSLYHLLCLYILYTAGLTQQKQYIYLIKYVLILHYYDTRYDMFSFLFYFYLIFCSSALCICVDLITSITTTLKRKLHDILFFFVCHEPWLCTFVHWEYVPLYLCVCMFCASIDDDECLVWWVWSSLLCFWLYFI